MSLSKGKTPGSLETIAESLKEIQDKLEQIENTIREPEKAAKPANWWKVEYIGQIKGYLGVTLLMALGTSGGFDSIEQWRNACRAKPPSEIPRSTFFILRNDLKDQGLVDEAMRTLTAKGRKVVDAMARSPFPVVSKKHLIHIIESL